MFIELLFLTLTKVLTNTVATSIVAHANSEAHSNQDWPPLVRVMVWLPDAKKGLTQEKRREKEDNNSESN